MNRITKPAHQCSVLSGVIQGLIFGLTMAVTPVIAQVSDSLLDRVDIQPVSDTSVLQQLNMHFYQPVQFRSQQSSRSGQRWLIQVGVTPIGTQNQDGPDPSISQSFRYQPAANTPLQQVRILPSDEPHQWLLELTFSHAVKVQAHARRDVRSLAIHVLADPASQADIERSEQQAEDLMTSARKALIDERDFSRAARFYRQVLVLPANSHSANALEYLGLSQERQGLLEPAIRTYQLYLERYQGTPDQNSPVLNSEPSDQKQALIRIRQRLNSLLTAANQPKPSLQALRRHKDEPEWNSWGSWSQFLRYDRVQVQGGGTANTAAVLSNDLEWSVNRQQGVQRDRWRLSAGYYADLGEDEGGGNSQRQRISNLYYEHRNRNHWLTLAKMGRFSSQRDGTLGRYDGVRLEFGLSEIAQLGVVAGYPVNSSRDGFSDTIGGQRRFYGASLALSPWDTGPDISLYGIEQTDSGLIDRRAIGTEFRYFNHGFTLFSLLDYDIHFQQLNIGLIQGSLTLDSGTTLSASYDDRLSPVLTSNNALIGQIGSDGLPITDLASLQQAHTNPEIQQLAQDRTARSQTLALAASIPVNGELTWASDATVSQTGATRASDDVAATSASGLQTFLNTRLTGSGWLSGSDIATVGLRTSDSDALQVFGGYFSHRAPLAPRWRLYSNLSFEQRQWHTTSQQQQRILSGLRLDYRKGGMMLEAELDMEWIDTQAGSGSLTGDEQSTGWYFNLGYRYDF